MQHNNLHLFDRHPLQNYHPRLLSSSTLLTLKFIRKYLFLKTFLVISPWKSIFGSRSTKDSNILAVNWLV